MERKKFLSQSLTALGIAFVAPISKSCSKTDVTDSTDEKGSGSCTTTPTETEGPFPTKSPSSLLQSNIVGDRTGVALTVKIYVTNRNNSCAPLSNAIVDIWQCDAAGNYSEYGGSGMQSTNYAGVHWLRGRQITDSNGVVTFTAFSGWYSGRGPHIHVHVQYKRYFTGYPNCISPDICNTVYTSASPYKSPTQIRKMPMIMYSDSLSNELPWLPAVFRQVIRLHTT